MTIGFIGLGNMGRPMALNVAKAGWDVIGFDVAQTVPDGLGVAESLAHLAQSVDTIITMLPNGQIVDDVVRTTLAHLKGPTLFLDCSTIDVAEARAIATTLHAHGHQAVDAPVSGGTAGAEAATLTFMAGGEQPAIDAARPLLSAMGANIFACGHSGAGQAAKICNNMILGITMIGTCEAFALADGLGLERQALFDVVSASSGQSWSMTTYCPAPGVGPTTPADNAYRPGFAAGLMLKDLKLSQQAADASSVPTHMGAAAQAIYERFVGEHGPGRDFSAILPMMKGELADHGVK